MFKGRFEDPAGSFFAQVLFHVAYVVAELAKRHTAALRVARVLWPGLVFKHLLDSHAKRALVSLYGLYIQAANPNHKNGNELKGCPELVPKNWARV